MSNNGNSNDTHDSDKNSSGGYHPNYSIFNYIDNISIQFNCYLRQIFDT